MPPRSKIEQLPESIRAELDKRLIETGFGGYVGLADWLTEHGFSIGKSAVGKYGQELERRLAAVKASTEAARLISQAAPDDADERSNAIISIIQTEIFDALMNLREAADEEDPVTRVEILGKAAKNIATLTRASVSRNKWGVEVRARAEAAAAAVDRIANTGGLSADAANELRAKILGIVE
ncbi:DUF3486 family protein [Pseudoxanthomonas sp. 22568]|uniref:DUF3486 family protein n=1 Tax=Pseudoxanthomonas sp. 22568 TaxID=3453945 RepID=UPI003F86340E